MKYCFYQTLYMIIRYILILLVCSSFKLYSQDLQFEESILDVEFSFFVDNVKYCNFEGKSITDFNTNDYEELEVFLNSFDQAPNILVNALLKMEWSNQEIYAIHYTEIKKEKIFINRTYLSHPDLEISKKLKNIIRLRDYAFSEFRSSQTSEKYTSINHFKKKLLSVNGGLDFIGLSELIENSEIALSKYLLK